MTFIVNARPYRGRFHLKAVALVKSGVRVGQVIVSEESPTWQCHICKANNSKPGFEAGMSDAWQACKCGVQFVLISTARALTGV